MGALQGRIKTELNGAPCITAENVQINGQRPVKRRKGAYGPIGIARGHWDGSLQVTFALPEQKSEFVEISTGGLLNDDAEPFSFAWFEGSEKYLAIDCVLQANNVSSDQDGDASRQVTIIPTTCEQVA